MKPFTFDDLSPLQKEKEIIVLLRKLKYTGEFPGGAEVLLVPLSNALDEAKVVVKDLSPRHLKDILRKFNILVFSNLEEYSRYLGKAKENKK